MTKAARQYQAASSWSLGPTFAQCEAFLLDSTVPNSVFYERADLTAVGGPLKIDKQTTPPFKNAAQELDGYVIQER